jgi:hypothetical protein
MKGELTMKYTFVAAACMAVLGTGCNPPADRPTTTKTSEGQTSSGPVGAGAAVRGTALVRFINAEPTIDKADLWFGDQVAFSGVSYRTVTPYRELPGDRKDFRLRGTGMSNDLAKNNEGLKAGRHHTLVAIRKADNTPALSAFEDSLEAPASDKAKIRFINAATNEGDLALSIGGTSRPLFAGVKFGTGGSYQDVKPGAAVIQVRSEDQKTTAMRVRNQTLEAGKTYTIIALGDGNQDILFIEDQLSRERAGDR